MLFLRQPTAMLALVLLAGCSQLPPSDEQTLRQQAQQLLALPSDTQATALPQQELAVETAINWALVHNPTWRRQLAELQITTTEWRAATRLANPSLSVAWLQRGAERETDAAVLVNLWQWLSLPVRKPLLNASYQQAQWHALQQLVQLATTTRRAYFQAVAAEQRLRYRQQVLQAAEASADLTQKMLDIGNISQLDAQRNQLFLADAQWQVTVSQQQVLGTRERLAQLLGLANVDALQLPKELPPLPSVLRQPNDLSQVAQQRLDLQRAKLQVETTAKALRLGKATRFISALDLGYQHNTASAQALQHGWQVDIELPIFDGGQTRIAQADAIYQQALAAAAEVALNANSELRISYSRYQQAHQQAVHYQQHILPLQQQISTEVLRRYNGMLVSTFEVISQMQARIASQEAALQAQLDFWLADSALTQALLGVDGGVSE